MDQIGEVQNQNIAIQQVGIHDENEQEKNLFLTDSSAKDMVRKGKEKMIFHPEKTDWLDTFGNAFSERIDEKTRKEKKKNRRSRLFVKAENEALLNKAESEYAGRLSSDLSRFLPAGINPMQADARDVAQFMIYGGEDVFRNKLVAKLFFSTQGGEDEKKLSRQMAMAEMAQILVSVDISKLHLDSDQDIANHADVLERLTGQVAAFDTLSEKYGYFDTLPEKDKKTLSKKLECLRAISAYYVAKKEVMKDALYRDHYNDELTYDVNDGATDEQKELVKKLMRTFVLGRVMMKLNGVSQNSLNKHRVLNVQDPFSKGMYHDTVREYGTVAKQKDVIRADAVRMKLEKKTGVDKLTLDDFNALINDKDEGYIFYDKKGIHTTDNLSTGETAQNLLMKQKLYSLISERMRVVPGSADEVRLRLILGVGNAEINKGKAALLKKEELRIAIAYMNQKASAVENTLRQGEQAAPVRYVIANKVKDYLGGRYDEQELAHVNNAQLLALREELQKILKVGQKLNLSIPTVSGSRLTALVKRNISVVRDEVFRQVENVHRMLTNLKGGVSADIEAVLSDKKIRVMDHIAALVVYKFAAESEGARAVAEHMLKQYSRKLALDLAGGELTKSAEVLEVGNLSEGGSNGLEEAVAERMGTKKAWRGKDDKVQRGTASLILLCDKLELIERLQEKALDEGLNEDESGRLIRLSRDVEEILAKEENSEVNGAKNADHGLMNLVAKELSGTRFKQGFKDAVKRYRDAISHPERNMGCWSKEIVS